MDSERPASLPENFVSDRRVPESVREAIADIDKLALCGGRIAFKWANGPAQGKPVTAYCQVPNCITTGYCTGPMFVPNVIQYEPEDMFGNRKMRKMSPGEVVGAVRQATRLAIGKEDPRSDREIAQHVGEVWRATWASIRGDGEWR